MLRENQAKQLSFHSILYHKIPKKHILKRINEAIDLTFVNKILSKSYCAHLGRPAREPEMLLRMHVIKSLYKLSDEKLVDEVEVNLAFKWFVGMNPEEAVIHPSLMTKFRTMRLQGLVMDDIITELVRQCIARGIIEAEDGVSIDSTHVQANTVKKVPERIMKRLAQRIFKEAKVEGEAIPDYKEIEDHNEAKAVMKAFVEETIEAYETAAPEATADAKAVLESDLFIEQKGVRSLQDRDARVGSKSRTHQFFGYKDEYVLTNSGLITAVNVAPGNYVDGRRFSELYEQTKKSGLQVNGVQADKAYFQPDILKGLKEEGVPAYIPVSASRYRMDEARSSYNKDSDQWYCYQGNETVARRQVTRKVLGVPQKKLVYTFDEEKCQACPHRVECMEGRKKAKVLEISINAPEYYEHSQWAKTEAFQEGYRKRARIEPKNAELKRHMGLARAYGYSLRSCATQGKLTAFAADLKRIANLVYPQIPKSRKQA